MKKLVEFDGVTLDQTSLIEGWRPLGNRIIAEPLGTMDQFAHNSAIAIPEQYKGDDVVYRVMAIGDGRRKPDGSYLPIPLETGWRIMCRAYDAPYIELDGRKLRLINVDTIELVLPP